MGVVIVFFLIIVCIGLFWYEFSLLTSIFLFLSVAGIFLVVTDIKLRKKSRETVETVKKHKAKVVNKEVIHGYRGKTTYTFEINTGGETIQIKKERNKLHRDFNINDTIDIYPEFDEQNNIVDFKLAELVERNTRIYKPFIIFAIGSIATTALLILNDHSSLTTVTSYLIAYSFFLLLVLYVGISSLKRVFVDKSTLKPVKAVIHSFYIYSSMDDGIKHESISPVYRVEVDGKVHQFVGDKSAQKEDRGKEVTVYYDPNTMQFFDNPKSKTDLAMAIFMLTMAFCLIYGILKEGL
ncbi:ABC transporter ATP-binding protein [Pallidibacillus pasinlerensis]|uniref:ABC transporter ATP-binding protein n=1 Tax=Pallidibacillus pasinlerensis TaxID=2703818 RepID=A0ABW9ZZT9_9BACI|nr:ABC transporter ATP-binding protein [Pallidibacillus pasinlerensis]NCU16692.1 ABC transporter ATP-binding protein [Pallidibacillus pasinlerensis]